MAAPVLNQAVENQPALPGFVDVYKRQGMILRLTEGSLAPVACLDDDPNLCPRQNSCATLPFWEKLAAAINQVVDGTTLADLVEEQKRRATELDYSI